jgi:hypothetical protein
MAAAVFQLLRGQDQPGSLVHVGESQIGLPNPMRMEAAATFMVCMCSPGSDDLTLKAFDLLVDRTDIIDQIETGGDRNPAGIGEHAGVIHP